MHKERQTVVTQTEGEERETHSNDLMTRVDAKGGEKRGLLLEKGGSRAHVQRGWKTCGVWGGLRETRAPRRGPFWVLGCARKHRAQTPRGEMEKEDGGGARRMEEEQGKKEEEVATR